MKQKERILLEKYSNNIQQAPLVNRILLANERQKQLMGFYDESDSIESLENTFLNLFTLYDKFLAEQASQRNHVQILNSLPLYLGLVRQAFILGYSEVKGRPIDPMYEEAKASYLKYNRFSLSLDYDFGLEQRSSSSELQFQATGSLGTANKTYMRIVPDSCWFKAALYDFNGEGRTLKDISIYLDVKSGTKSYRDEDNKLVTQSYSGPLSYPLLFPDFKIDFCDNSQFDSVFITGFAGDENVLAAGAVHPNGPYRQDMLYYLNMLFYSDVLPNKAADFEKMATDIMNKVAEIQATIPAPTALGRLRQAYLGKRENDGFRKKIRDAQVSQLAKIPFYAYSRQQVMTDVRHDVKKRDVGTWRVTKGQIHMRIEHEPVE